MTRAPHVPARTSADAQQLRHDLLNPLHVMLGTASVLLDSDLSEFQRTCVQAIQASGQKLLAIADNLETYQASPLAEGRARLADLCSIAAARVGKPFDKARLISTIEQVAGQRPLRILLVDDAPEVAVLVRAFLTGMPWELDVVGDGEGAVARASSEQYDLLLMDIDLPGMDGASAAHAIRAADLARGAVPIPIVALTAFDRAQSSGRPATTGSAPAPQPDEEVVQLEDPDVAALVPEFLDHRRADVGVIRRALSEEAFERIQSCGHRLKGTGRGYGFTAISRLGEALEIAADRRDAQRIAALADELETYLSRVRIVG